MVKFVSFLVFLLITASRASSSDDSKEIAVRFSQVVQIILIEEALNTPEISSQLSSSSHEILYSFSSQNVDTLPFYDFALQNYNFNELGFDSQDPQYWNAFINYPFRDFSRQQPDRAQLIINEIVLPRHPFLSQVPFTFQIAEFLGQFIPDIDIYLDKVAYDIFSQHFSRILALEDPSEAQILLKALLYKAKNTLIHDTEFKYHHAFLANVPFDCFKRTYCHHFEHHNNIGSFIYRLAPALYHEIAKDSKQLAEKILSGLLYSVYSIPTDTSYENTIREYQESFLQLIDRSYLWDPQIYYGHLLKSVQALSIIEGFNMPPYLKILKFLSKDSPLSHIFCHYIAQSYRKPSNLTAQNQPFFWRSLIFSSFSVFSSLFPNYSRQILEQLQLLPSSDQFQSLFIYGILDDQFSSKNDFPLVSGWGHTATVDILLQRRNDITAFTVGLALRKAAKFGHTATVELILRYRTDIDVDHVGLALEDAAICGHIKTVELILQRCTDITHDRIGLALESAARWGHAPIVDILIQTRTDIIALDISLALRIAAQEGHTRSVDILLQRRTDIATYDVGLALRIASQAGNIPAVDIILQRRPDITSDHVGGALINAARGGYTSTIDFLLQRRADIDVDHVGLALEYAAICGHIKTVELILQRCTDIAADRVGIALKNAARCGHTIIVDLLFQYRTDITHDRVGLALESAARCGHDLIVELIIQRRTYISADHIVSALRKAARGGHTSIVDLILRSSSDIPAYYLFLALYSRMVQLIR